MIKAIQAGVPVARIEIADATQMDAINKYSHLNLPVAPTLWLEFHGTEASVAEQAKMVQTMAFDHGGTDFSWATKLEDRRNLWRARHDVAYADKALREGGQLLVTDVCVQISRLAECISETQKDLASHLFYPLPSLAMPETEIFTLASCLTPMIRRRWQRPNGLINVSLIAHWHWKAPALANTVSDAVKSIP